MFINQKSFDTFTHFRIDVRLPFVFSFGVNENLTVALAIPLQLESCDIFLDQKSAVVSIWTALVLG